MHRLQHPVMDLYFRFKINNRIEIDLQNEYDLTDCNYANNYEFLPAVKIARLAVDKQYKNNGVGSTLINHLQPETNAMAQNA